VRQGKGVHLSETWQVLRSRGQVSYYFCIIVGLIVAPKVPWPLTIVRACAIARRTPKRKPLHRNIVQQGLCTFNCTKFTMFSLQIW
jgi:hypothetical protein